MMPARPQSIPTTDRPLVPSQFVHGVIVSVEGAVPGRDFTYTCDLNLPTGLRRISGIFPANGPRKCWQSPTLKFWPQPVGTAVIGALVAGRLELNFDECPDIGPCDEEAKA